ncbi:GNAT family N-acetyltransferase [Glutamicibacter endophyticus]|uniref:GNAT family N-acetyltransferase n=1 Tax=Glutamicibacter endophyticus TaxID=1522174 RepID=UPI003AEFAFEE
MLLHTERLRLRELSTEDFAAVHAFASDPEVCRYSPWGPNSEQQTRDFIHSAIAEADRHPRTRFTLAIECNTQVIGAASFTRLDAEHGEIGYTLERNFWSRGYATEAAQALLDWALNTGGCLSVIATCRPENIGSWRVLEKIGMRRESLLAQHIWIRDHLEDSYLYRSGSAPVS